MEEAPEIVLRLLRTIVFPGDDVKSVHRIPVEEAAELALPHPLGVGTHEPLGFLKPLFSPHSCHTAYYESRR